MTAFSLVQDTLFYNIKEVKSHYYDQGLASSASIVLGNNSWLCSQSCALQGTSMGDDSVLSTGSVCFQMDIKDYHLCVNNPVIRPLSIDKLQRLKRL